jgi:hypothetical protein
MNCPQVDGPAPAAMYQKHALSLSKAGDYMRALRSTIARLFRASDASIEHPPKRWERLECSFMSWWIMRDARAPWAQKKGRHRRPLTLCAARGPQLVIMRGCVKCRRACRVPRSWIASAPHQARKCRTVRCPRCPHRRSARYRRARGFPPGACRDRAPAAAVP